MIIVFGILAALCLAYYVSIVIYAGIGSAFAGFWLLAAFGFSALSCIFHLNKKIHIFSRIPRPIMITVCIIISCGVLLFLFLFSCMVSGMVSKPTKTADYIVVLGAQIRGESITKSLRLRLDKAVEYYEDNNVTIIVSGGQGQGEDITEASAMKKYLVDKGIPEEDIIEEDKSTNTNENLRFSYEIICDRGDEDGNILICSNNFHIFRAVKLGKHIGMKNVEGLSASSDNKLILNYMVRDSFAIFKEFLIGNISITD